MKSYFTLLCGLLINKKKVSYRFLGAKNLAAADADDKGYHVWSILLSLFSTTPVLLHLMVESKSLFETITTLHQTGNFRLLKLLPRV